MNASNGMPAGLAPPAQLRALGAFAALLLAFWSVFALYVVHASLPYNAVRLPYAGYLGAQQWAHEGWGFFTRDPREEKVLVFARAGAGWASASQGPNGRPANAMGMNRLGRAQAVEFAALLHDAHDVRWGDCTQEPERCMSAAPLGGRVHNMATLPTLCGEIGFARRGPVPFAWALAEKPVVMPSRVMRLEVAC